MIRPARLVPSAAFAIAALAALPAGAAFSVGTGYPLREGVAGRIFADPTWNPLSANVGYNRADCFDTKQVTSVMFVDVPADATTVEIWARRDNTSCADPTQRAGTGATTPQCYKVASWTRDQVWNKKVSFKPIHVIQAIDKTTNVEEPTDGPTSLDPETVCAKSSSMPLTQIYLQVMAFNGTTVIGFTSGGTGTTTGTTAQVLALPTSYDIAGPNPPSGLTLGAGNTLLIANFSSTAQSTSDFKGYRAYCFPGSAPASPTTTKSIDGGLDVLDDAVAEDTVVEDTGVEDTGADDSATTATDSGTSGTRPEGCPAGDPFVPGQLPSADIEKYRCGAEATSAVGEMKITGLANEVPYAVAIGTTDRQGNSGPLSEVVCGMPKETDDFYNVYRRAGGAAGGGWCAMGHGPASSFAVAASVFALALVARLARRARPRR